MESTFQWHRRNKKSGQPKTGTASYIPCFLCSIETSRLDLPSSSILFRFWVQPEKGEHQGKRTWPKKIERTRWYIAQKLSQDKCSEHPPPHLSFFITIGNRAKHREIICLNSVWFRTGRFYLNTTSIHVICIRNHLMSILKAFWTQHIRLALPMQHLKWLQASKGLPPTCSNVLGIPASVGLEAKCKFDQDMR